MVRKIRTHTKIESFNNENKNEIASATTKNVSSKNKDSGKKIFILDTNVLIHDPKAYMNFDEHKVILLNFVTEEIDKLKKFMDNVGYSAREVSRNLKVLRKLGKLCNGVTLENGGIFQTKRFTKNKILPFCEEFQLEYDKMDNRIIVSAMILQKENPDSKVILVSKDTNITIDADSLDVEIQDYETDKVSGELYSGSIELDTKNGTLEEVKAIIKKQKVTLLENQYILSKDSIFKYKNGEIISVNQNSAFSIMPKTAEQNIALDLLMDTDIQLISIVGQAGTGKTLLTSAVGLEKVLINREFKKLRLYRPFVSMGNDIGYLPGGEKEKIEPWLRPIKDNLIVAMESYCKYLLNLRKRQTDETKTKEEEITSKTSYIEQAIKICEKEIADCEEKGIDSSKWKNRIDTLKSKQTELDGNKSELTKHEKEIAGLTYKGQSKQNKLYLEERIKLLKSVINKIEREVAKEFGIRLEKKVKNRINLNLAKARQDIFSKNDYNAEQIIDELILNGTIVIESLSYIRGRTFPDSYIIIDETQNLTPHEMKTIITRAGENSKIVVSGDTKQIDNIYLNESSNGLSYLVETMKDECIVGTYTLVKTVRSKLAELAANKM